MIPSEDSSGGKQRLGSMSKQAAIAKDIETSGSQSIETRRLAGGHNVSRIGCDELWNSQTHPNCKDTTYSRSGGVTLAIQES
jgi:hypothetical protein